MAVKAANSLTVYDQTDVLAVTTFYQRTSSTANPPTKPTTTQTSAAVSGWSTAMPAYGSSYRCYKVERSERGDGTCVWGAVTEDQAWAGANGASSAAADAKGVAQAAKDAVDSMEVGGRNLLRGTATMAGWEIGSYADLAGGEATLHGTTANWSAAVKTTPPLDLDLMDGRTSYVLSLDYRCDATFGLVVMLNGTSGPASNARTRYISWAPTATLPSTGGEWRRHSFPARTALPSQLTSGSGDVGAWELQFYNRTDGVDASIRRLKLERGTVATDWTPAPEDAEAALAASQPFVAGTQTASAYAWTGSCPELSELRDGQQITYWLPRNCSGTQVSASHYVNGSATATSTTGAALTLTLAGGASTGSVPVYYSGVTRVTTHYAQGNAVHLTYREDVEFFNGTTSYRVPRGWWADANYDSNTTYTKYSDTTVAGLNGLRRYTLCMADANGRWTSIVNQANNVNATGKTCYAGGLKLGKVLYHAAGADYAAGANGGALWESYGGVDLRYSANGVTTAASTTALKLRTPVYLVGTVHEDGLFYLDSTKWWTQDEPASEDGKVYVLVGTSYSSYYAIFVAAENPAYIYSGGAFKEYWRHLDELAQAAAASAMESADGKNMVFHRDDAPPASTPGLKAGDTWFETDAGNKMYRWSGSAWVAEQFGNSAIKELSADKLTAGTIDASKVTVSNLDAGNITTGTLGADRIGAKSIEAGKLNVSELSSVGATLGGFQVDATSVHTKGVAATSNAANSVALSSADFTRTVNGASRTGLRMAIGSKFGVSGDGTLYANGANITSISASNITTGTLDASKAKIVNLDASAITSGTISADRIDTSSFEVLGDVNEAHISINPNYIRVWYKNELKYYTEISDGGVEVTSPNKHLSIVSDGIGHTNGQQASTDWLTGMNWALYTGTNAGDLKVKASSVRVDSTLSAARGRFTTTVDASGTAANAVALMVGDETGTHLEFDGNEIMAKASGTTTGPLYINNDGGAVYVGGKEVSVAGHTHAYLPTSGGTVNGSISIRHADLDRDASESSYQEAIGRSLIMYDGDSERIGVVRASTYMDGPDRADMGVKLELGAFAEYSSTEYSNWLTLRVSRSGVRSVTVSDAASWRSALAVTPANIGAAASSHTHSYLPLSGGTVTGAVNMDSNSITDGTKPSANQAGAKLSWRDSKDAVVGYVQPYFNTDGRQGMQLYAQRPVNGSAVYNGLSLYVDAAGTRTVAVSDAAAWRSGLGITPANIGAAPATATKSSAASQMTMNSGFTLTSVYTAKAGAVLTVIITAVTSSALTNGTTYDIGTLAAGLRPYGASFHCKTGHQLDDAWITTGGVVRYRPSRAFAANGTMYMSATYVVA